MPASSGPGVSKLALLAGLVDGFNPSQVHGGRGWTLSLEALRFHPAAGGEKDSIFPLYI